MTSRVCLVHYHEIGLKGKNRSLFENQLVDNIRVALKGLPFSRVRRIPGHILVTLNDDTALDACTQRIAQVPGVAKVSRAFLCDREPEEYCAAAVSAMGEAGDFESFKVHAKRSNTDYELHTLELNSLVGSACCEAFPSKKVQMHGPDLTVDVLVNQGNVFVFAGSTPGVGGLPVGTAGKVMTMLSSGFDSPVATWMVGRRGAICLPVHFSGRPMTADTSEYLCQDLVRALEPCGCIPRLYVVPFGECQRQISLSVPEGMRIIMYRRLMFAVVERLAAIENGKAVVTGESLGQVASQTLDNIWATDDAIDLPVFRPLIGSDKQEIIERAHQLGTFDICCETAPDCCTLFMPRKPETHARLESVRRAWESFDHEAMVEQLVRDVEYVDFGGVPAYRRPRGMRVYHRELGPVNDPS